MTEVNLELNQVPAMKNKRKDSFSPRKSFFLIFLTLVLSVGGWFAVGKYYFWNNIDATRVNQQLEFYKQKVQSEPNNAKARVDLGYTYFLKKNNEAAVKEFNQALVIDPKDFDAYYNMGLVYIDDKRYNEALSKLSKAVELSPRDYKGHLGMGIAYRNLKMFKEAKDSLTTANKLMPTNANIIYEIGKVAEDQGDKDLAIEIYKEVLKFDPLYKSAIDALEHLK